MRPLAIAVFVGLGLCSVAGSVWLWPQSIAAATILLAADAGSPSDAARLLTPGAVAPDNLTAEAESALAANDPDLALSFIELADASGDALPPDLRDQALRAREAQSGLMGTSTRFAKGLVTGQVDDGAALAGAMAGDLTLFGDVRDLARESWHYLAGRPVDTTLAALATAGLAVTAGTYASLGTGGIVRAGVSATKAARRSVAGGRGISRALGKVAAEKGAADAVRLAAAMAKDGARIERRIGVRGLQDAMRLSETPKDLTRVAALADKRGGQTRALLKLFGRGALVLGAFAVDLAGWVLWLVLAMLSALVWIKATTEALTRRAFAGRRWFPTQPAMAQPLQAR